MYAKTEEFDATLREAAVMAKALSHPARLAILLHLAEQKSCYSGDIAEELPLSRTTVSQHLQELKRVGLIEGEIEGTRICYCIDVNTLLRTREVLEGFFAALEKVSGFENSPECAIPSTGEADVRCAPALDSSITMCC